MSDLDNLICFLYSRLFDVKLQKISAINKKVYEKAAFLRNKEREYENRIYEILFTDDIYDRSKIYESISKYCLDNYGFDYNSVDEYTLKQKIREIKLKQLGII